MATVNKTVNEDGVLTGGASGQLDADFDTVDAFYNNLTSNGNDLDLRDDFYHLYVSQEALKTGKFVSLEEYENTDFGKLANSSIAGETTTFPLRNSRGEVTVTTINSDIDTFGLLLGQLELTFQQDVFKNVSTKYDTVAPKKDPIETEIKSKLLKVTPANAKNTTVDNNEKYLLSALVKYDQDNGRDAEFTGDSKKTDIKWQLLHVSGTDLNGFANKYHLTQNEKQKLNDLFETQRDLFIQEVKNSPYLSVLLDKYI